jgi:hypothetical protein
VVLPDFLAHQPRNIGCGFGLVSVADADTDDANEDLRVPELWQFDLSDYEGRF